MRTPGSAALPIVRLMAERRRSRQTARSRRSAPRRPKPFQRPIASLADRITLAFEQPPTGCATRRRAPARTIGKIAVRGSSMSSGRRRRPTSRGVCRAYRSRREAQAAWTPASIRCLRTSPSSPDLPHRESSWISDPGRFSMHLCRIGFSRKPASTFRADAQAPDETPIWIRLVSSPCSRPCRCSHATAERVCRTISSRLTTGPSG